MCCMNSISYHRWFSFHCMQDQDRIEKLKHISWTASFFDTRVRTHQLEGQKERSHSVAEPDHAIVTLVFDDYVQTSNGGEFEQEFLHQVCFALGEAYAQSFHLSFFQFASMYVYADAHTRVLMSSRFV